MDHVPDKAPRRTPRPNKPSPRATRVLVWAGVLGAFLLVATLLLPGRPGPVAVPLTRFEQLADDGALASAVVDDETRTVVARLDADWRKGAADGTGKGGDEKGGDEKGSDKVGAVVAPAAPGEVPWGPPDTELAAAGSVVSSFPVEYSKDLVKDLDAQDVTVKVTSSGGLKIESLLSTLLLAALVGAAVVMVRRGGAGGVAGAGVRRTTTPTEVPDTRFADVVGCDEAVAELAEVVQFFDHRDRYDKVGARVPRGFLLVGPPGTGKTLLARACAGEAGVPFFAISASDLVELYVGMGASRVRKLFEQAAKHPRAIVFIDELDSVGKSRNASGVRSGANDEQESTLNALLVEMDGFARSNIVVLAATNRPDVLDPALLRAGRFDRQVHVPAPDRLGREQLFAHYLDDKPTDPALDPAYWARRTVGMSGADIEAVCNDAALEVVRRGLDRLDDGCMEVAVSTAFMGRERRSALVSDTDRAVTAWHEAGHTVVALCHRDAADPVSVSIVPRGPAGGVTWLGEHDHVLSNRDELLAQVAVMLGGRAGETVQFGALTQGSSDDIRRATELVTAMVTQWGMGAQGPVRVEPGFDGTYPDAVRVEVQSLLVDAEARAVSLLGANRPLFDAVAEALLERETLDAAELAELVAAVGANDGGGPGHTAAVRQGAAASVGESGDTGLEAVDEAVDEVVPDVGEPWKGPSLPVSTGYDGE